MSGYISNKTLSAVAAVSLFLEQTRVPNMAYATEGVSESVEAVRFSFMTDEEVRRHSVVKITNPILRDSVVRPVPAGFYDPAMGPLDDHSPMWEYHMGMGEGVEKRAAQLELIAKGNLVGAKSLDSVSPSESINPGDSDGSRVSCSTVHYAAETYNSEHSNQGWTSVQFIEAMAILNKFLKPQFTVLDGLGNETDQDGNEVEIAEDGEIETVDIEDEASKPKPRDKKTKSKLKKKRKVSAIRKDYDRSIFVAAKGLDFEVHFRFTNEPHILLGQRLEMRGTVRHAHGISNYDVEIDYRHLSLIADFMTHAGGYRPMSRHGGIAGSISPFLKISFETTSKFNVEAASHEMTDNLESPSARICLGLPVKMGTGCFDLMQKLEI
ncbi:nuclear RNA polymerase A1 [Actinidia rufa]|uniref:DNA-directed RNA polymerase n=1 Tax=Actinidia rufa TaxID=165716 RepID=A0A7J0FC53_9ERIC|nr:nuclear RNA polymerase A1 [Actinidia rufa]